MRCKDCPGSDEEAKVVAEAFGLPVTMHDSDLTQHLLKWNGKFGRIAGPTEIAMWHALVRSYRTLVQFPELMESL